ncbi:MAG: ABC transporter substrate-binding protein [Burkholderiaceae bacterium]
MSPAPNSRRTALSALAAFVAAGTALPRVQAQPAQPGWVVGISRPYTGPLKGVAAGYVEAAKALFDHVNAQGGIAGARLELIEKDDEGVPAHTEAQVKALASDPRVLALIGVAGTGNVLAALPALEAARLPLVGPFSGAAALRGANQRMLFHVRAGYDDEINAIAQTMVERAPGGKVVVLYQDDPFGAGAYGAFLKEASGKGPRMSVSAFKFDRTSGSLADPVAAQQALKVADAVLLVAAPKSAAALLTMVRAEGRRSTVYTLSVVDALALVKDVGANVANGTVITQVMPNPRKSALKVVRDYRALMEATKQPLSYAGLEGYIAARVVIEGLSRIKGSPSRDKLVAALEDLGRGDLGGFAFSYSRKSHEGSKFVDLSLVSASGSIID